ncbi:MAG TPA: YgjP-like metallopeptidase domain-containing protein [Gammaproteobacteria bacterium]|nr:YgjP-like metallopeptidase domain-containing protein [Gammaproteobacteria bacterium]
MNTRNITALWPPVYNVRRSPRARRTFLQITPAQGLEIVVPARLKRLNIEKLLEEKRGWIEKMLVRFKAPFQKIQSNEQGYATTNTILLEKPHTIECLALNETWQISYQPTSAQRITLKIHHLSEKILILKGDTDNIPLCLKTLKKWLMKQAHACLIPWLQNLSLATGLHYHRVTIRRQTTLWGSCNAKKNISLNYKLLFLPKTLTKHVLLHELCHLKHLNHSEHFWLFLKSFDPQCTENKKALKLAGCYVPAWLARV